MAAARQVAIVGNGPVAEGSDSIIDACDLVIRFNASRNFGAAGTRTDVVAVCNTGRPAAIMLADETWRDSAPVQACSEIWSVRDPGKMVEMRSQLAITHPDLNDFCDDYTAAFANFATASAKTHRIISRSVHEDLDRQLLAGQPPAYVIPSSGLLVLHAVLHDPAHAVDTILLAGFGHHGWDGHPFDAERRLIDALISSGRLTRLQPLSIPFVSQGA
jgi:hypothetical protein